MDETSFKLTLNRRLVGTTVVLREVERTSATIPLMLVTVEFPSQSLGRWTQMSLRLDLDKQHFVECSKNPIVNRRVQALALSVSRIVSQQITRHLPS